MGVPKFYRWISERYPKINQIISDNALLPEFDHLYLDMNGIIHGCTHPPDMDVSQVLSERDMMMGIMHYLDRIISHIVKPKVSVYMAIDGVAPRAKLNQQRARRFRSAKDMAEQRAAMQEKGGCHAVAAIAEMFDSNCITPGTEFLAKVSEVIRFFIRKKIKEDPLWKNLTVIFSGHDIPGEGEHKIMDHIRQMRSQPDYQPNTRHCIYGQDADLIMLGLVTHEPHFTILREIVDFNSFGGSRGQENTLKQVKKFTKESDFQLLHLSVLREYLAIEFCISGQPGQYDLERCIDDFVFMTFLVGNDFLPHLPALDIGDGAFDMLFSLYKELRTAWGTGNYLTNEGQISDPARLEMFISAIGIQETEILARKKLDEAAFIKKKRKWEKRDGKVPGPTDAELQAVDNEKASDYQTMIQNLLVKVGTDPDNFVEGWQPEEPEGREDFKGRYYFEKLCFKPTDKEAHWKLRKSYMEGLVWCLAYYYRGCISWGWFYPYHYGPMLSDLIGIPQMFEQISFEYGQPLTPFQQLMACLPPGSAELVPELYRWLMISPESPIIRFYPEKFVVDMNGKRNPWEGVNLLPFIDADVLKDAIAKHCPDEKLSAAERKRNDVGKVYAYQYDSSCTDAVLSPIKTIGLIDLPNSFSRATVVEEPKVRSPSFRPRLIPGTKIPYPGFPSLNVIPITTFDYVSIGLNCFGTPSKYPSCLLTLQKLPELPPLKTLAQSVLGISIFVNWPMMHEAKVVAISDETQEIRLVKGQPQVKAHTEAAAERWQAETERMKQMYFVGDGALGSGGVNIGDVTVRLKVLPLQGMKLNTATGATKKVFGREEADVPLQLGLVVAPAPDPRFQERGPLTIEDRFKLGSSVVLTRGKFRGCRGVVVGIVDKKTVGVKVYTMPPEIPFGLAIARTVQETYISSGDAARILKIDVGVLGKIAGRLSFDPNRYDLGLNLKSPDGLCVPGYTRKRVEKPTKSNRNADNGSNKWSAGDTLLVVGSTREGGSDERIAWEYSPKAIRLVEAYRNKFPQLFVGIAKAPHEKKYDANTVFGPNGESWLPVIREWLNGLDSAKLPRNPVTTHTLSMEAVAEIERASDLRNLALKKKGEPKVSIIKIPAAALYLEGSTGATNVLFASDLNNGDSPQLGDRIVNLAADGIPFGMRGTVVGIHEAATTGCVEVVMDEEFIGGTTLQGLCSKFRGKLCLWSRLLKVAPDDTKGMVDRLVHKGSGKAAAVAKILRSIDPTTKPAARAVANKSNRSASAQQVKPVSRSKKASPVPKPPESQISISTLATRNASTGRADSAPKGRQVGWREARGPNEDDDNGFKWKGGNRKGQSGVARWKDILDSRKQQSAAEALKSTLGIVKSPRVTLSESVDAAAEELKAKLGVGSPQQKATEPQYAVSDLKSMLSSMAAATPASAPRTILTPSDTTSTHQLKAALGVGSQAPIDQPPPPQACSLRAADRLMQMMASSQPYYPEPRQYHPHNEIPQPLFNFTYVKEGSDAQYTMPVPSPPPYSLMPPTGTYGQGQTHLGGCVGYGYPFSPPFPPQGPQH